MESEPVLMEIHLSEARLTNGITNDGEIIPAGSRTICHAESSIVTTGGETLRNIHTKLDTCGSVSIAHSSYLTQVNRATEHGLPQIRLVGKKEKIFLSDISYSPLSIPSLSHLST
jgi:hypothetical protein